jgi:TetR/AcrR family transcriptional regulator, cholesterol catabolism regulator
MVSGTASTPAKPARRSRSKEKAKATRQRILDAAARQFRENGYTGTRLADIATAAQTQTGSLYYHFASREELVQEVLRVGQERTNTFVIGTVEALPASATALDRLVAAMSAHLTAILDIGDYTAATLRILGQVPDEIRAMTMTMQREYGRFWRTLLENASDAGALRGDVDLPSCMMLMLGAMNATPDWFDPNQPHGLTLRDLEDHFEVIFLKGLSTAKGRRRRTEAGELRIDTELEATAPESRAAVTTARILDSAAKVFRKNGYAGTRLLDVASDADIQTGSLYYHFDSREDLVSHLLHRAWQHTDATVRLNVDALPPRTAPINRLSTAMTAHLLSVLSEGDYTSAMLRILGQVPPEVRSQIAPLQRGYLELWRGLLRSTTEAGDIRPGLDLSVVLMIVTGALNWTAEWYRQDRYPAPPELARQACAVIFDGLTVG